MENYTHRSGRTGRAGKSGISIVIVNLKEIYKIKQIEKQLGKKFAAVKIPTGSEVCEKQLYHLVEKMKNTEVQQEAIEAFLPGIYEQLQELSKEEIIQRVVSAEFNRFLSYYRDAPDINVDMKRRETIPGREDHSGVARLSVNLGLMERFTPKSMKTYLTETAKVDGLRILNVHVMKSCSFFETDAGLATSLIGAFKKVSFRNRRVFIGSTDSTYKKGKSALGYSKPREASFANRKKKRF
jgi:ATP-dependent RNA helicase DeaD